MSSLVSSDDTPATNGIKIPQKLTAIIAIIGDEIFKKQMEEKSVYITRKFFDYKIKLQRVMHIPSNVDIISDELRHLSLNFDIVLTIGGICPNHGVTIDGVSKPLTRQNQDLLKDHSFRQKNHELLLKLTQISNLNINLDKYGNTIIPLVYQDNVFMFPKTSQLLRNNFEILVKTLLDKIIPKRFFFQEHFLSLKESEIWEKLNDIMLKNPSISFGFSSTWNNNYYKTKLIIKSLHKEDVNVVEEEIKKKFHVIDYDENPLENALEKLEKLRENYRVKNPNFTLSLDEAFSVIKKSFGDYKPEEIITCFNGGKDCIVILHLIYAFFTRFHPGKRLRFVYIQETNSFPEMDKTIEKTKKLYNLNMIRYQSPMKQALEKMVEEYPIIKATFLGTRRGDPGSKYQNIFSPTDQDWPKLMRINPIFNWSYNHVWKFIQTLKISYPSLYDIGYTSIGNENQTLKNPSLKYLDQHGKMKYRPAYKLKSGDHERDGR